MKEFRYLVEAGPNIDPALVKEKLAELLDVNFDDLDNNVADSFIKSFNFVAPVPFGTSLDVPSRTAIRRAGKDIQYVITGIADEDIETLKEFGYVTVFVDECPFEENHPCDCIKLNDDDVEIKYYCNGKEVTDPELIKEINNKIGNIEEKLDKLTDWFFGLDL